MYIIFTSLSGAPQMAAIPPHKDPNAVAKKMGVTEYKLSETPCEIITSYITVANRAAVHKEYLASTDWYELRALRGGKSVPEDVAIKRAEAIGVLG